MSPEILKKYAKAIEENNKFEYIKEKEVDINKTYIKFDDSAFSVNFRDSYSNDLRSKFASRFEYNNFSKEEILEISNIVLDFIEKKYKSNLEEAKKEYTKMLIEKL